MTDLSSFFTGLVQHHIATDAAPLPTSCGVQWIWAQNGIFKRGANADIEILIDVNKTQVATPGLISLLPFVRWHAWPQRLPGDWLSQLLIDARRAAVEVRGVALPAEKQYFVVLRDGRLRLIAPQGQEASATRVRYAMPDDPILLDIHSHHGMQAFFSNTDTHDDAGLSVSVVIGRLFDRPEMICRLNVHGHHQIVPALTLFDQAGPFVEATRSRHAIAEY